MQALKLEEGQRMAKDDKWGSGRRRSREQRREREWGERHTKIASFPH
jgi:hypothetical protein